MVRIVVLLLCFFPLVPCASGQSGWQQEVASDYTFGISLPPRTKLVESRVRADQKTFGSLDETVLISVHRIMPSPGNALAQFSIAVFHRNEEWKDADFDKIAHSKALVMAGPVSFSDSKVITSDTDDFSGREYLFKKNRLHYRIRFLQSGKRALIAAYISPKITRTKAIDQIFDSLELNPGTASSPDKEYSTALVVAASKGDASSQNDLAIAYSEGLGIIPDQKTAVYWFRKSAENGYVYGACNYGIHLARGLGVRKNVLQGLKWSFIANAIDGLKCQPGDFIEMYRINQCDAERAWQIALAWLRAHPEIKNVNFGGGSRPWMGEGEFGITRRTGGSPVVDLPVKSSKACKTAKPIR